MHVLEREGGHFGKSLAGAVGVRLEGDDGGFLGVVGVAAALLLQAGQHLVPGRLVPVEGLPGREGRPGRGPKHQGRALGPDEVRHGPQQGLERAVPVGRGAEFATDGIEQRELVHVIGQGLVDLLETLVRARQVVAGLDELGLQASFVFAQALGRLTLLQAQAGRLGEDPQAFAGPGRHLRPGRVVADAHGVEQAGAETGCQRVVVAAVVEQDRQGARIHGAQVAHQAGQVADRDAGLVRDGQDDQGARRGFAATGRHGGQQLGARGMEGDVRVRRQAVAPPGGLRSHEDGIWVRHAVPRSGLIIKRTGPTPCGATNSGKP